MLWRRLRAPHVAPCFRYCPTLASTGAADAGGRSSLACGSKVLKSIAAAEGTVWELPPLVFFAQRSLVCGSFHSSDSREALGPSTRRPGRGAPRGIGSRGDSMISRAPVAPCHKKCNAPSYPNISSVSLKKKKNYGFWRSPRIFRCYPNLCVTFRAPSTRFRQMWNQF